MNDSPYTPNKPEDEIHLLDYLIVLAKHSRMIIYTTVAVVVFAYFYQLLLVNNEYTSTARILPPQQNMTLSRQLLDTMSISSTSSVTGSAGLGGMAASFLGLKTPGDLYVGILSGNTIYDQIIEEFNLNNYYKKFFFFKYNYREDLRKNLNKYVYVNSEKDGIITIQVSDKDQKLAASMANAFVEKLDQLLQHIASKDANDQLVFLEKERSKVIVNLTKSEEALRKFGEESNVIQIDTQAKGMLGYIANLRATIDAKEVQLLVVRQQKTSFNYDVVRLETELKELKAKLKAAETQAETCIGDVCIATNKIPSLGLEYIRLYREAKYQEKLYELYCRLVELARLDASRDIPRIQYIDRAIPAEKRSKPKRLFNSLLIGIVFLILMSCGVFFWEFKNRMEADEETGRKLYQIKEHFSFFKKDFRYLQELPKNQITLPYHPASF